MAEIKELLEILHEEKVPVDLWRIFRSDSVKAGLEKFYLILEQAIEESDGGKLGFESWNLSQTQGVVSIAKSIVSASRSLPVENAGCVIVGIAQLSVAFCICFFEKSGFSNLSLDIQKSVLQLLEIALFEGMDNAVDVSNPLPINTLVESLPIVLANLGRVKVDQRIKCNLRGTNCSMEAKPVDRVLMTLVSDYLQPNPHVSRSTELVFRQDENGMVSVAQHWAVVHVRCIPRLIILCKELLQPPQPFEEQTEDGIFQSRMSFSIRILKLLGIIVKDIPYIADDANLLLEIACCADSFPSLFRPCFDFFSFDLAAAENSLESLMLLLLEEFFQFVQVFCCDTNFFHNVQTCIHASIFDILDAKVWRYDKSTATLKPPLVYSPRIVIYLLKLVGNIRNLTSEALTWKEKLDIDPSGCSSHSEISAVSCHIHYEKVSLLRRYRCEEHLEMIFQQPDHWVDNLMHLAFFLHSQGAKSRQKIDRSRQVCAKSAADTDADAAFGHEDEALFGDLFSEAGRQVGLTDGHDQSPVTANSISSYANLPLQAATEVLMFLKAFLFSPEWRTIGSVNACQKLNENHISILISMLQFQVFSSDERASESAIALALQGQFGRINEVCFDLLHSLLIHHALSGPLEEHLIDQIVKVENGVFVYNDRTLTLLVHALISRAGSAGSHLRTKLYKVYVDFIFEKVKIVCSKCSNLKEIFASLPCIFHIEILLMAFHMSTESEKATLADYVFSALKAIVPPLFGTSTQLSCWSLLVSRLVLVLRHMIVYPSTFPSWLLLRLRTKLREVSSRSDLPHSINDQLPSWASVVIESLVGEGVKEQPLLSTLLHQLIDVAPVPSLVSRDDQTLQCLCLNWDDLCAAFSWITGLWRGKKPEAAEDLILERYIFLLCWDTLSCINCASSHPLPSLVNMLTLDTTNMNSFFLFNHFLVSNCGLICNLKDFNISEAVFRVLQQLQTIHMSSNVKEQNWDFLRSGSWLFLVLSLLQAGAWQFSVKHSIPGVDPYWTDHTSSDIEFFSLAENLVVTLFEGNQIGELFKVLSCLLRRYLQVLQDAFLSTLNPERYDMDGFLPLLLLKHTRFDKCMLDALLKENRSSHLLGSIFGLLSKLDEIVAKEDTKNASQVVLRCLLHGFPSHSATPSGDLVSCILSVEGIISALYGLIKIKDVAGDIKVEVEVLSQLLDMVMAIKTDRIFQGSREKCDAIYSYVISFQTESFDCRDLFLMKHMEKFLKEANSREGINSDIRETLITSFVDIVESIRKDSAKANIFKFYLGSEDNISEQAKGLYSEQRGDLLVLMDAMDTCHTESINLKVLNLFIDPLTVDSELCSHLKEKVQKKFLGMELSHLSKWLEKRLLGCIAEDDSGGTVPARGSSAPLRELTMNFVITLMHPSSEMKSRELHGKFIEAMLLSLDSAFMFYEINSAKAFFNFIVQLCNGQPAMKQLLKKVVMLMEQLAGDDALLQGLKYLLGFLGAVLSACGANKNLLDKLSGKHHSGNSFGSIASRPVGSGSRKGSETLALPTHQETGSALVDCDATSVDEDEDDGTSDGELASVDKDDDADSNSERILASKVCTFTSSGSNFMEQHWYFCYTCDLTFSKGCCSVCAKVCHRGHRVIYSRSSRFFCDCGAGGVRGSTCQCLKPRKFAGSNSITVRGIGNFQPFLPFPENGDQLPDSDSDLDDDSFVDMENMFKLSFPKEEQDELACLLKDLDVEGQVLKICNRLLPAVISRRDSNIAKDQKIILDKDKVLSYSVDILQLKKAYKSRSLDLKIKADYSNSRELKSHLSSGSLIKCLLSVSIRGRLAAGEGDKVAIFDVGQLIGQPTVAPITADKTNVKPLSRNVVQFEIVHLVFNPVVDNYLAVAGYEECQVLTVNPRGEVTDRLAIELALQGAYIRRIDWVPGSQVQLMVVTNTYVKIYDLSLDNISPMHYFTLKDDMIVDAILVMVSQGRMFLLVLSELGCLFRLKLSMEGDVRAKPITETIQVWDKDHQSKGLSLYFSPTCRLLFLSYQDGTTLIGRLDANATVFTEISAVYEDEQDGKLRPAGLHNWREVLAGTGLYVCFSSPRLNAVLAISMGSHKLFAQNMRHTVGSALPLVGITAYRPLSKDKTHVLVLHDDGNLQIFSYIPVGGADTGSNAISDLAKKLGSGILSNRAYAGSNPEFPLDFFEKTVCITQDVKLSGDAIRNGDSEGTKQNLASDDGFLESPSHSGFKVTVLNSNPDIVMVGFCVHVGSTSASHIPSEIAIFQRAIKMDEGMKSWYDIPFTVAEALLADEEFTITIGPTFSVSALPRIDSLEVYGRAKDEFGWKEKMDAVLDMEAHALGSNSGVAGTGKKYRSMQAAPIQEQVIADGLKLLSGYHSLCRSRTCSEIEEVKLELGNLKCKKLLATIFESDREPLLQSAACCVLQAVFPNREIYYHVKDTMRLLGVANASPVLVSRIGVGGSTAGWVIQEFTAQMHVVTSIAFQRRSNMVAFMETHGTGVVDGLMEVLWGILDLEQPETQTINNIVIPSVELIYSYAECLSLHGSDISGCSVAPAVILLRKLLFAPYEAVQTSSSLAISSRLLQVPFPKQTMLATDDVIENSVSAPPSDIVSATGGNTQVMIEEDSTTSSVQYCCDGCSTVPILRRRWHCNVCPDFDLCKACYEVMDADRLPPPHTRDHPMSAIPIELDSIGADGNEIQFSMDELNESSLLQVSTDIGTQNDPPSIHILEPNEVGDFPTSVNNQRIVSISASKRAVNSLLLRELVENLRGWMKTTSGIHAIPIMQLFYRLSSAVGGPFMDSSKPENLDLEKFVRWFLDEINLNKPFSSKSRSSFGEVVILVFMFFTLMLRNWHQPGSENLPPKPGVTSETQDKGVVQVPFGTSPSSVDDQEKIEFASQLLRACSALRQQAFVNYLMDILQQLVNIFKSPSANLETGHSLPSGSGCGALLTVRKELPAGNFSPFFSDSYAKAHRADFFMDYHRLLLENTFRLIYGLVRPEKQDKSTEKDKVYKASAGKDLKLDEYQDVFCSYINNSHTAFVRRYARRLFLHLCGSKTHYYNIRDSWQLSSEIKRLYKLVNKSGSFRNPVPYERSVKLVKCLSAISEVAEARPRNWQKYCSRHGDVLSFLMNGIFYFMEESVIQTLKLLNLAFYTGEDMCHSPQKGEAEDSGPSSNKAGAQSLDLKKKNKAEDGNDIGSEKSYLDMEQAVEMFTDKDGSVLNSFVESFLLEWNSSSVRVEAKFVLYGIWHHGKHSFKETLLTELLRKVKSLPMYGQNVVEYTELLTWLLGKGISDTSSKQQEAELINSCLTNDVIKCIFETLHSQNELLANHPNSRIYNTLSSLVEFDGYYLESEPCVACSCPEVPYSRTKLESLKSETKFTDNRIIVKCTGSYTILAVTMNIHDARKSKSVKVLNLYYNNRPVADLSELKNNWSMWKRAKSCHLAFNQTDLKVEFPIPITACNFMIELDSFYENLHASSLESLQCPRCSRSVTDKHGICSNCHENAYQCRQCRNINYENLDSFLCNECGYSKYGCFEFNFMAKPSFSFDNMENDEDMKKGLAAIESESENAHRRYQQLLGFKKPLLKLVSSIGENDMDSQQKESVQQMMVSLPGPSCKINRKIALLRVLYGDKCKAAFDSVSKSVQTLQGLRRVLMSYLHQKHSINPMASMRFAVPRSPNNCYGCAITSITQCLELLLVLAKHPNCKKQLIVAGLLSELFENNIHQGPKTARIQARAVLCAFSEGDANAVAELNSLIQKKVMYCLEHHRSMDIAVATREELILLSETFSVGDEFWEARLRVAFQLLFSSIKLGAKHPAISEHIILPCLRIISIACTPPKPDTVEKAQGAGKPTSVQPKDDNIGIPSVSSSGSVDGSKAQSELSETHLDKGQEVQILSYSEWEKGASYLDFVRRQYKVSQAGKPSVHRSRRDSQRVDYLALKYALRWKQHVCKRIAKGDFSPFELGSWVSKLVLSACSQSIRSEICTLIGLLCAQSSSRRFRLLNLLIGLLPATLAAGESAAEYFEILFKMIELEDARLFFTVKGCLTTICRLISQEVGNVESQERSLHIDISQGFILHKLVELLSKFLEVPNIRCRFMRDELLSQVLEALLVIRGLVVQKTKLINDCNRLLKELLDSLLLESSENKRHFIRACISGLQNHGEEKKGRTSLFILEQLCNMICPSKPEPAYLLILNKAHSQEEFIRGSMTKNPYSSTEIGPLMRDVKNKICHQLDLLGLLEDDYGMELLVTGNIISLDLSIAQVYEQVWEKSHGQSPNTAANSGLQSVGGYTSTRDCLPMTVTYRLQGLDGEATEPMIKELEEDREESQDPEVEFAIAGVVQECGGLEIILSMIQRLREDELKANQEELESVLDLLMYCCKIRENRRALLQLGALGLLLETARRAFSVDAVEPAEGLLLIVESLTMEANESDIGITQSMPTVANEETEAGEQAKKIVLMFLERLCHPSGLKKSNKQQRNNEMVVRILPNLTYGELAAMEALIQHFDPYLQNWGELDRLQKQHQNSPKDETLAQQAARQRFALENFVRVSESLKTSSYGERMKDIILEKGIPEVAVRHLRDNFAFSGEAGFNKSSSEWMDRLKLPSTPLILSMLRGLARGHFATQRCIDEGGILPLLHTLEGVSGENELGARAENLLDTLADKEGTGDGFLREKVHRLRRATIDEMRRRALRKREELLQGLGMRQELASDGGERIVVSQPIIEGLDDVQEEEDGPACMVCREGYSLRPTDTLGVYSYSKRVNLGTSSSGSARRECVYTTVSHFNIIHFQCHQEAKRADAALKNPKKEWEGAALRNNETLCNCIFPLWGPSVPLAQYARHVDQYWDNLSALGRADGSRLRLLTYDVVLMLARFATGASFSTDCKGGGRESNSRLLPFMIQMSRHLLDEGSSNQRRTMAKALSAYLSPPSPADPKPSLTSGFRPPTAAEETVQFMMVNSLLVESYQEWLQHRRTFLQRGIYHTYMQYTHGRSTLGSHVPTPPFRLSSHLATTSLDSERGEEKPAEMSVGKRSENLFVIIQPMLVYTGLIERLQRFFKVDRSGNGDRTAGNSGRSAGEGDGGDGMEEWEVVMKERMLDVKDMVGLSEELLAWLEDMQSAADLQEALEVMGMLDDVLSGGFVSCEEFVQEAIVAGRS